MKNIEGTIYICFGLLIITLSFLNVNYREGWTLFIGSILVLTGICYKINDWMNQK